MPPIRAVRARVWSDYAMIAPKRTKAKKRFAFLGSKGPSKEAEALSSQKGLWPCSRARGRVARLDQKQERGGDFDGTLNYTLHDTHNAVLSITGVEVGLGEGAEGRR